MSYRIIAKLDKGILNYFLILAEKNLPYSFYTNNVFILVTLRVVICRNVSSKALNVSCHRTSKQALVENIKENIP
jgi:hypothetical protein